MTTTITKERHLRRDEAAEYLRERHGLPITKQALAKLAVHGGGPLFQKFGKFPLYSPSNLDQFAEEALSPPVRSTAELPRRSSAA